VKTYKKITKAKIAVIIGLLGVTTMVMRSNAQCGFGPVPIICHDPTSVTEKTCCPSMMTICGNFPWTIHYTSATKITVTTMGMVWTCGGGTSALSAGAPFEGLCVWTESGSNCAGPWGPVPKDGPVTLRECIGSCPPPA
jgi:hypothetical protein